ncbi:hypothetical protein [Muricoccus aerilatus]|uniref:hypothetical protein n=1 Tax=Muricoccus aerilatus TaxID=452982 RepID=UPI0012EB2370|nr:hypothetical protein [Roseomonas aerilata]
MARIPREEHARIRERVDLGQEKVAAVAASYGCTPANIYAILTKLRREDTAANNQPIDAPSLAKPSEPSLVVSAAPATAAPPSPPSSDRELPLFDTPPVLDLLPPEPGSAALVRADVQPTLPDEVPAVAASPALLGTQPEAYSAEPTAPARLPATSVPAEPQAPSLPAVSSARRPASDRPFVGGPEAKAASSKFKGGKAGIALLMRTNDGEEAVHPFRSIEELLSAAKPILRTAAKSPEPIWFSIQTVDLDTLEDAF